ncbi:MAG: TetR family transcriptional regulator [Altererythrobacter sp.]|nr:TetR family transcriptional regulator [Altererythrobacter sp.]
MAGIKEFAAHGYRGASLRDIAKRADTNVAEVRYHYSSKYGHSANVPFADTENSQFPQVGIVRQALYALWLIPRKETQNGLLSEHAKHLPYKTGTQRLQICNQETNSRLNLLSSNCRLIRMTPVFTMALAVK